MDSITQADREAAALACRLTGWRAVADRMERGWTPDPDTNEGKIIQAFAAHRRTAHSGEGRSNGAGEDRLREALAKQTFLTCVSGDGPTPYLKVHFNNLSDAHAAQDEILGRRS